MKNSRILRGFCFMGLMGAFAACQGADGNTRGDEPEAALDVATIADLQVVDMDEVGVPTFANGSFGRINLSKDQVSLKDEEIALRPVIDALGPIFEVDAKELSLQYAFNDNIGDRHFVYAQHKNGLEVLGGALVLHSRDHVIYAVHGGARSDLEASLDPQINADEAVSFARKDSSKLTSIETETLPHLAYRPGNEKLDLVYVVKVTGFEKDGTPVNDDVLVSASDGSILQRIPHVYTAENREMHDLNHGTSLPGPTVRTEGGATVSDQVVNTNYDRLGSTWDCYKTLFNRDSFDNAGAKLISSVHYSNNYVNAYWNSSQMVYGDGDGVNASNLANSMDVTAHELTHAVTERSSNLTYSGESGGLNESMSDIFGNVCEWFRDGQVVSANTWMVGEDIWTPSTPNDALRYMSDPAKDGSSKDYWDSSAGSVDVHYSSGISNLAFYLLSQGGTHPRGKSTTVVTGIGIAKAAQVFYRANTVNLVGKPNATFADAKTATEQAASQLGYTTAEIASVTAAWTAVGVGGGGGGGGSCAHDKCSTGTALASSCNSVVSAVCAYDSYCCSTSWDSYCVAEGRTVGKSLKCSEATGSCSHSLCTAGTRLTSGCDSAKSNCAATVCYYDPYCCTGSWDSYCVGEVATYCGLNCN